MTQVDDRVLANQLGDLTVMAEPPAKMLKARAVIEARSHAAYDECVQRIESERQGGGEWREDMFPKVLE